MHMKNHKKLNMKNLNSISLCVLLVENNEQKCSLFVCSYFNRCTPPLGHCYIISKKF